LHAGIDTLGTLGDFTATYILENQDILLDDKRSWIEISKLILTEFFKSAGKGVPDWIQHFVEETGVQDAALEQEQIVRGFFIKTINDYFTRNYRALTPREEVEEVINESTLWKRLDFCCEKQLIPFLIKKDDHIMIFHDIIHELKNRRINYIMHLTQLARMFQSEVKPVNLNGNTHRLISVHVAKFLEFISPAISL